MEVLALLANPDLTPGFERMLDQPDDDAHQSGVTVPRQKQRRLAPDQIADLLVKYTEGSSVSALANEYGVHRTTVMTHLERAGVPRRPHVRKLTDHDVAVAAHHYRQGESIKTAAARFGVTERTLAREFQRAGVPTRPRRGVGPAKDGKGCLPTTR